MIPGDCPHSLLVFASFRARRQVEVLALADAWAGFLENSVGAKCNCTMPTQNKEKPVHQIRLGSIKAAIWKNDTDSGVRFNTTLSRLYKDGEEWKSTDSFGRDDLLLIAKVADQVHTWICDQNKEKEKAED
jgi:hypothetical protein